MFEREGDVGRDRAPGQQREVLEHGGDRVEAAGGSAPSTETAPPSARINPPTIDSSVDFPQPDGPITTTTSRASTVKAMSASTGTPPKAWFTRSTLSLIRGSARRRRCP